MMAYRIDNKYTFYHICKTGGTSVRAFMENISKNHKEVGRLKPGGQNVKKIRAMQNKHCCPLDIPDHQRESSFTVIRHPIDWYKSIYKSKVSKKNGLFFVNGWRKITTFDSFIKDIISIHPYGVVTAMYCRVIPYVDYILKLENIRDELPDLFRLWGYKNCSVVRHKNKSPSVDVSISEKSMRILLSIEHGVIKKMGY